MHRFKMINCNGSVCFWWFRVKVVIKRFHCEVNRTNFKLAANYPQKSEGLEGE